MKIIHFIFLVTITCSSFVVAEENRITATFCDHTFPYPGDSNSSKIPNGTRVHFADSIQINGEFFTLWDQKNKFSSIKVAKDFSTYLWNQYYKWDQEESVYLGKIEMWPSQLLSNTHGHSCAVGVVTLDPAVKVKLQSITSLPFLRFYGDLDGKSGVFWTRNERKQATLEFEDQTVTFFYKKTFVKIDGEWQEGGA